VLDHGLRRALGRPSPLAPGDAWDETQKVIEDSGPGGEPGEDLVGLIGRVTVSIPGSRPGEVLLPVRGGTEGFAAWADEPIAKGLHVIVIECLSPRSVFVTPFPDESLLKEAP
jgi:hypothetical protein